MAISVNSSLLLSFFLFFLLQKPTFAVKKSYIVYLGGHSHGAELTSVGLDRVTKSHNELLGSFVGSIEKAKESLFYSYTRHINGFAAMLEEEEAAEIAKHQDVASVFENKGRKLHTTRTWSFLGVEDDDGIIPSDSIWKKARFGEDTIIGNLDTGVWPESESFSDEGMGPVPSRWRGFCQHEEGVRCNKKLIGARYFSKGYGNRVNVSSLNFTLNTARDHAGHGTHTLSTLGGNFVPGASIYGYANGTAKGGSPKARVAAYKVCWPVIGEEASCFDSDIIAGFDAAIADGVDVLSVSIGGGPSEYFSEGVSIGAFHAVRNGITVVCSAGNDGPADGSVLNVAPWILTVGASTHDRVFSNVVALGNKKHLKGTSLAKRNLSSRKFYPLISGSQAVAANATTEDAALCLAGTLDATKVKGKILVCLRGKNGRVEKGEQAALVGAAGMILVNDELSGNELRADAHVLPASNINFADGQAVFAYINSTKSPMGSITGVKTQLGEKPSPFMAPFSSKGPNSITPEFLKPDITAPGVNVLAAYTQSAPLGLPGVDKTKPPFALDSGTSMSCPHVAGIVGLLKTLHPDWSPAALRSAIMTTAFTRDNTMKPMLNSSYLKATPFSYGAGHVRPNSAMDPGLVYDLSIDDYLKFLCTIGYNKTNIRLFYPDPYTCSKNISLLDLNYPSITVPSLIGSTTITRIVKNVGTPQSTYRVKVRAPLGVSVSVRPKKLKFSRIGEEKTFKVTFMAKRNRLIKDYVFGRLVWSDGKHYVRSQIVVKQA